LPRKASSEKPGGAFSHHELAARQGATSSWAVTGFFLFGAVWYGLTWLRTRELDGRRPR
jgi:hypothetical protein